MLNTVSTIWTAVALIIILGALFVIVAAIFPARSWYRRQTDRQHFDIKLHEQRVQELHQNYAQQHLTAEQFEQQEAELNQQLLMDIEEPQNIIKINNKGRYLLLVSAILMITVAIWLYQKLGAMEQISAWQAREVTRDILNKAKDAESLELQLKQALSVTPANAEGWYMLANVQMQNEQFDDALASFAQAFRYIQLNSSLHDNLAGTYAQALFHIDKAFTNRVNDAIDTVLQVNKDNISALSLQGIKAFEAQQYQQAIYYWQQAQNKASTEEVSALQAGIDQARKNLTGTSEGVSFNLTLDLAKGLDVQNKVNKQAVIFIYAKETGQRAPLLARKIQTINFPQQISLSAADAIRGAINLADYTALDIGAHISFDGTAIKKSGDFYGEVNAVQVSADGNQQINAINLTIDSITP